MQYAFFRELNLSFDEAESRLRETLRQNGFGVLTEIDVKAAMKEKLGVEFDNYKILGACNPPIALKALIAEPEIGVLLPCNLVVIEDPDGGVRIGAIDPVVSLSVTGRADMDEMANHVKELLKKAVEAV